MSNHSIQYCLQCGSHLIEKIHTGKLRPTCPACGWVYFPDPKVAVVVLLKKDNQVLLVQRRFDPMKDHWTLPGGFVDAGEDPVEAARRECLEETGLNIKDVQLLDVIYTQEHPRGASILILYQACVDFGTLAAGDDTCQVAYFQISGLPPLAFTSTKRILSLHF